MTQTEVRRAAATESRRAPRRFLPGPHGLVLVAATIGAARLGLRPISDNSTLVHLRTGIELVHHWTVPHRDPYSFTAFGHSWVVQSWLASLAYGLANALGHHALMFVQAAVMAATGAVIALIARSATAWRSGIAAILAICASAPGWSPRPLMFGLLCLALTVLVVERRANPWWLVPVAWVWVNTHGSFPLGLAWLAAHAVGEVIDSKRLPSATLKRAGTFVLGLVLGAVNPVGVRILTFPLTAIGKRHTFQAIVEWRSPNFQDPATFVALVFIVLSLVVLLRAGLPWAQLLPVCAFIAAALVAERNLGPLGVVLAAPLAAALSSFPSSPRLARLQRFGHLPAWRAGALGAMALVAIGLVIFALGGNTLDLSSYPVAAVDHLAATGGLGPDHRIAAADVVGCYLIWRAGPQTKVFIDDRYDMYPASVVADAAVLGAGRDDVVTVLDRWHIDTVIAHANEVFPAEVARLPGWSTTWKDRKWVVLTRA